MHIYKIFKQKRVNPRWKKLIVTKTMIDNHWQSFTIEDLASPSLGYVSSKYSSSISTESTAVKHGNTLNFVSFDLD